MKVPKVKEPKLIRVGRSFRKLRNVKKRLKGLLKLRLFLVQKRISRTLPFLKGVKVDVCQLYTQFGIMMHSRWKAMTCMYIYIYVIASRKYYGMSNVFFTGTVNLVSSGKARGIVFLFCWTPSL